MIPASYFFKNAYCRQWEQPETPEGVPAEETARAEQGLFRRMIAAIMAAQGRAPVVPECGKGRRQAFMQRG